MTDTSLLPTWGPAPGPGRERRENAGGRVVFILVLLLVLLVGGGYATAYLLARDKVPRGTTVAGVDVGGRTRAEAAKALAAGLAQRSQEPLAVRLGGRIRSVSPGMAGLGVDYAGSVAAGGAGRSWDAKRLWSYYTDGPDLDAVISLDPTRMAATLDRLATLVARPARDGAVSFGGSGVSVRQPEAGQALDLGAAQQALVAAYAAQIAGDGDDRDDAAPVVLPTRSVEPAIGADDVRAAVDAFADPALAGPVTLRFAHGSVRLSTRDVLPLIALRPRGGRLVPEADEQLLLTRIGPEALLGRPPVDAGVALTDGAPRVVPSVPGTRYTSQDVAATVLRLLARRGDRTAAVPTRPVAAPFGDKQARALRIREAIATATTAAPASLGEPGDLDQAASAVDGVVLRPGAELSLRDLVGERGLAPAVTEQLASTVYDAALSAGLDIVERHAPLVHLPRLHLGRDAVVSDTEDLRVRNPSTYGVLLAASTADGSLTLTAWSTAEWDVALAAGAPYDVVAAASRVGAGPGCAPRAGRSGFTVDVTRTFRRPGRDAVVRTDTTTSAYLPVQGLTCRPVFVPPDPTLPAGPDATTPTDPADPADPVLGGAAH